MEWGSFHPSLHPEALSHSPFWSCSRPHVVVQSLSRIQLFSTPQDYSTPGFPVLHARPVYTPQLARHQPPMPVEKQPPNLN